MDKEKIKILIVRPGEEPEEAMIVESASSLQDIVGGYFELVKPPIHTDDTKIICNEEGKLNGSETCPSCGKDAFRCRDVCGSQGAPAQRHPFRFRMGGQGI